MKVIIFSDYSRYSRFETQIEGSERYFVIGKFVKVINSNEKRNREDSFDYSPNCRISLILVWIWTRHWIVNSWAVEDEICWHKVLILSNMMHVIFVVSVSLLVDGFWLGVVCVPLSVFLCAQTENCVAKLSIKTVIRRLHSFIIQHDDTIPMILSLLLESCC